MGFIVEVGGTVDYTQLVDDAHAEREGHYGVGEQDYPPAGILFISFLGRLLIE